MTAPMTVPLDEARLREFPTNDPTNPLHRLGDDLAEGRINDFAVSADVAYALKRIAELEDALSAERSRHMEYRTTADLLIASLKADLQAERDRADRAVGLLRRVKASCCGPQVGAGDGGTHVVVPPSPDVLRDVNAFLATQKAEGAQDDR